MNERSILQLPQVVQHRKKRTGNKSRRIKQQKKYIAHCFGNQSPRLSIIITEFISLGIPIWHTISITGHNYIIISTVIYICYTFEICFQAYFLGLSVSIAPPAGRNIFRFSNHSSIRLSSPVVFGICSSPYIPLQGYCEIHFQPLRFQFETYTNPYFNFPLLLCHQWPAKV